MKNTLKAYIGLILMILIVGFSFLFVKMGLAVTNSYDHLAHRFNAAFLFVLLLWGTGIIKIQKIEKKEWLKIIGVSIFYPVLCFGFQTVGLEYATTSQAGIIFALVPVITLLGGTIFLKEKTSVQQKIGIVLSVAGVIYLFAGNSQAETGNIKGTVLLLLSVTSMVVYYMIGKKMMERHDSLFLTGIMILVGFVIFNVLSVGRHLLYGTLPEYAAPLFHARFLISVLYLGVLSSVLTSFFSNYALVHISTTQISVFNNLIPIITILAGILVLHETLSIRQIVGGAAVMLGVVLVVGICSAKNKNANKKHTS